MDYLLFRLYGPMASWGDIAIGESRHSLNSPTKTAVMGMIAAALGIKRDDEYNHSALNENYSMATAVLSQGQLLRDYHTTQAPDSVGKFRYRTRRDELVLGKDRLGTVLSSREYRTDALSLVAIRLLAKAPFTLHQIQASLREPQFTLYLGRKSCPLAAPLDPQIISADNFQQAFKQYSPRSLSAPSRYKTAEELDKNCLSTDQAVSYYWEGKPSDFAKDGNLDRSQLLQITQHDQLLSRQRWQYAPRQVYRYCQRKEA